MNTAFEMPLFDELNRQSEFVFIRSKDGDIQGVYVYVNLLKACFRIETRLFLPGARRVYCFKRHGIGRSWVGNAIEQARVENRCDSVLIVPGSTPEETRLQMLFGAQIKRVKEVSRRKCNNKCELPEDYGDSLFFKAEREQKVLLVDDVCTTGRTLRWFRKYLEGYGYESVMFCLGLNVKMLSSVVVSGFMEMADESGGFPENYNPESAS